MGARDRLAVFIDYQNAYRGARQAFGIDGEHHVVGQFDPYKLAKVLETRHPNYAGAKLRKLVQVRVYSGVPSSKHSKGYGAARKQMSRWCSLRTGDTRLEVCTRQLDYRTGSPREKGIDVMLALDLAFGAANGEFDVVVLFSGDSDLLPALERAHASGVACETAAWTGGRRKQPRRSYIKWEHRLVRRDYDAVHDAFDYVG